MCAVLQKYQKSHGTKNPGIHLTHIHPIHEDQSAKSKRMIQAHQLIQMCMGAVATIRKRENGEGETGIGQINRVNKVRFPPLVAKSLEILYVSTDCLILTKCMIL